MSSSSDNTKTNSTATTNTQSSSSVGESPTIRAIMSSSNNNSNITYEDYDWMGVLDNLDDHSFSLDNNNRLRLDSIDNQLAASNSSTSQLNSSEGGHHEEAVANLLTSQPSQSQGDGQNDSASMSNGRGVAVAAATDQKQQGSSITSSSTSSSSATTNEQKESTMPSLPSINAPLISQPQPQSSNNSSLPQSSYNSNQPNYKESEALKKERKRHREKQRRLDTNEQFNALADIVKDIDNFDFNNEALFCLELYGPNNGPGEVSCGGGMNGGKSDVWEGMTNQQQQQSLPMDNNIADPHSSSKKLKSDYNINNNMNSLPPLPNPSSLGNRNGGSGSKALPQSTTLPATTTTHPIISTTSTSNRIDLIARTISQLQTFRSIRNTRNNELRLEKRKVCELKKENEELRRMVAHYKTVGMGKRLQEKVMMMVPMMVPQDQVSQIQQGYAVPHHSYGTSAAASAAATPSHFATTAATASPQWATQPMVYHQPQPTTMAAAGIGGQPAPRLNHSVSAPPDLQQGGLASSAGGASGDNNSAPQAPPLPNGAGDQQAQQQLPPPTQGQDAASPHAAAYPAVQQQQQQQVMVAQQQLAPQLAITTTTMAPPAMAMYPQVTNGVPSVAFGLHPHQPQMMAATTTLTHPHVHPPNMSQPQAMMGVATTNNNAPQDGSTVDTMAQLNGLPAQQQGFDRQASQGSTSSDKPAAAAPPQVGGGGNLAHCA